MATCGAVVLGVHDGDTIKVAVRLARSHRKDQDLKFHVYVERGYLVLHESIRLRGCNAIELRDAGGVEAQANLAKLLPVGSLLLMQTESIKDDKYGSRFDAAVLLSDGTDLVKHLIATHWAAPWDGSGPRPLPTWPRPEDT